MLHREGEGLEGVLPVSAPNYCFVSVVAHGEKKSIVPHAPVQVITSHVQGVFLCILVFLLTSYTGVCTCSWMCAHISASMCMCNYTHV